MQQLPDVNLFGSGHDTYTQIDVVWGLNTSWPMPLRQNRIKNATNNDNRHTDPNENRKEKGEEKFNDLKFSYNEHTD